MVWVIHNVETLLDVHFRQINVKPVGRSTSQIARSFAWRQLPRLNFEKMACWRLACSFAPKALEASPKVARPREIATVILLPVDMDKLDAGVVL